MYNIRSSEVQSSDSAILHFRPQIQYKFWKFKVVALSPMLQKIKPHKFGYKCRNFNIVSQNQYINCSGQNILAWIQKFQCSKYKFSSTGFIPWLKNKLRKWVVAQTLCDNVTAEFQYLKTSECKFLRFTVSQSTYV